MASSKRKRENEIAIRSMAGANTKDKYDRLEFLMASEYSMQQSFRSSSNITIPKSPENCGTS